MRCLLKITLPTENANQAAINGTLGSTIESILNDVKPEAAYFAEDRGQRTGFVVVDLKDTSQIPSIAEPWFLAFNANIEFHPCMNLEDLRKAVPGIDRAVKQYRVVRKAA